MIPECTRIGRTTKSKRSSLWLWGSQSQSGWGSLAPYRIISGGHKTKQNAEKMKKMHIFSIPLSMSITRRGGRSRNLNYLNLSGDLKKNQAWGPLEYWKEHGFWAWVGILIQPRYLKNLSLRQKIKYKGFVVACGPREQARGMGEWSREGRRETQRKDARGVGYCHSDQLPNLVLQSKKPHEMNLRTVHLEKQKENPFMYWFRAPWSKVSHSLISRLHRQGAPRPQRSLGWRGSVQV